MKFQTIIALIFLVAKSSAAPVENTEDVSSSLVTSKSARACKSFSKPPMRVSSKIIGGSLVEVDEFPHFASIGKKIKNDGSIEFQCGGTLISEKFVLSAAHCKEICKIMTECVVRLGSNTLNETSEDYSGADFYVEVRNKDVIKMFFFQINFSIFLEFYYAIRKNKVQKFRKS
jgi:Trypsin